MRAVVLFSIALSSGCLQAAPASVRELVQSIASRSVTDLVEALPTDMLSAPTFVYQSHSLQGASFESPRVLLSDPSGRLVLAFNGDPTSPGYDVTEAMEFDVTSARFRFYELSFTKNGALTVSGPNPARCLICHRDPDPRPNWESYDHWPGVFGSLDDALSVEEVSPFQEFLSGLGPRPRYRTLRIPALQRVRPRLTHYGRLPGEPNITFTYRLSHNNFQRVARLITESKDYARYKFLIAAFLASQAGERFSIAAYVPLAYQPILAFYSVRQREEAAAIADAITTRTSVGAALTFRSLFEARGIDTSDWFMNFQGGLTNTFINGLPWEQQLLSALRERDPSLNAFLYLGSSEQLDLRGLQDASNEALESAKPPPSFTNFQEDPKVPQAIWDRNCRHCHQVAEFTRVPQFDFSTALRKPNLRELVASGKMPALGKLTASEKERLLRATR